MAEWLVCQGPRFEPSTYKLQICYINHSAFLAVRRLYVQYGTSFTRLDELNRMTLTVFKISPIFFPILIHGVLGVLLWLALYDGLKNTQYYFCWGLKNVRS